MTDSSPIRNPSDDEGADTLASYWYQHTYSSFTVLAMFAGQLEYEEAFWEHHEDLLMIRSDTKYGAFCVSNKKYNIRKSVQFNG